VEEMKKPWYKSVSIWTGLAFIGYGVYCAVTGTAEDPTIVIEILGGLGILGLRRAIDAPK